MIKDLISIIIPVYNVEPYIYQCIESIVNQSYKNLEIILIDDDSTDKSGEICEEWKMKDSRIVVIHNKKNGGVSNARNIGLEVANGEFIGFIDSDDYICPDMYELMKNKISDENANICFCNVYGIFGDYIKECKFLFPDTLDNKTYMRLFCKLRFDQKNFVVWNKLFRTSDIDKLRFDETLNSSEDILFLFKLLDNDSINKITRVDKLLYYHRNRSDSIVGSNKIESMLDNLEIIYRVNKIFEKNSIEERYLIQSDFIGNLCIYEERKKRQNLDIDLSRYNSIAEKYLSDGILKKVGMKKRIKLFLILKFKFLYLLFVRIKEKKRVL